MNEEQYDLVLFVLASVYLAKVADARWEHVNPIYSHGKNYVRITLDKKVWDEIKLVVKALKE